MAMSAKQVAESEITKALRSGGGVIRREKPNLTSTNSDQAFILTFRLFGMIDRYLITRDKTALNAIIVCINWLFTQTDQHIKDREFTCTDWQTGKPRQKRFTLAKEGYAKSPRREWSPGWCRYIDVGGGVIGFRPEILCDGFTSYAIVYFIAGAGDELPAEKRNEWLQKLAAIFQYHEPSWRDEHEHSDGAVFGKPHKDLKVAGYWWPSANDGSGRVDATMPGFNQQSVFLSAGLEVERLLDRDISARDKARLFVEKTLPRYLKMQDSNTRLYHAYDLRKNLKEPANDTTHAQKANIFFTVATEHGLMPSDYQRAIIKQVREVCHRGNGRMSVMMNGSDDHAGGYDPDKHASASMWAECLQWAGSESLIPIAEQTLKLEHTTSDGGAKTDHKSDHFRARYLLALHKQQTGKGKSTKQPAKEVGRMAGEGKPDKSHADGCDMDGDVSRAGRGRVARLLVSNDKNQVIEGTEDAVNVTHKGDNQDLFHVSGVYKGVKVHAVKAGETVLTYLSNDTPPIERKIKVIVMDRKR